jgi:hypothetical protein
MPEPIAVLSCGESSPHGPHTSLLERSPWVASCPGVEDLS